MKRLLFILFVVAASASAVFSQSKKTTEFGIDGGLNMATVSTSTYSNSDYRVGFNLGISLDNYFSNKWSIKGKLSYNQKGWNRGYISSGLDSYDTNYKLNYITIPVMANWHFGRTKNWYLQFGPYVGILLNASESTGGQDVKNAFNTTDGGIDVGIGVKFQVSPKTKFFIEFNGQSGISDIAKDNTYSAVRNNASNFNIGLAF